MIGIDLKQAQRFFFDRDVVQKAADRATRRVLSRFGAFVKTRSSQSIRKAGKKKKVSNPGDPPLSHTGLLKKNIFFLFDPQAKAVLIGPVRFNAKVGRAAGALELGGKSQTLRQRFRPAKFGGRAEQPAVIEDVTIRPRPYMRPAFAHELERLPQLWRGAIVK